MNAAPVKRHTPMTGAEMRGMRAKLDMTQMQLAAELDLHERTISHYEHERRPIPRSVALAMIFLMEGSNA